MMMKPEKPEARLGQDKPNNGSKAQPKFITPHRKPVRHQKTGIV